MAWRRSAVRIYRALLFAYPAEFRHEYGSQMEQLFEDRLGSEPQMRVWLDTLTDVAVTAPREHLHILASDLRYGVRMIRNSPAFTLVALLAMALGIGATTAVFSLVNAVLIRSLPYSDPTRLVYIWTPIPRLKEIPHEMTPSSADFYAWKQAAHSFSALTLFQQERFILVNPGAALHIGGARVAGNFFQTLGASAELGRVIEAEDDQPGRPRVAVISDHLWHSMFAGDLGVLGKTLQLNRDFYQVVGVMPPAFSYPHKTDFPYSDGDIFATQIWVPSALTPQQKSDWSFNIDGVAIGRLRQGVRLEQAQAEMSAIETRIDPLVHPPAWRGWAALVRPFIDTAVGPVRPLLWLLLGAVSLVLLIACANVANLLLARAAGRVHEMGIRTALGAERARLIRQMLTEAVLLSLGGGVLGIGIAYAAVRVVIRLHPGDIPRLDETSLDARVLLFTGAASLLTGLAFGLLPALAASRVNISNLLKQGGGRGIAGTSNRLRNGLIVTEVALSVILLAAAGLLIRSYMKVQSVDTGFASSTVTMPLRLDDRYDTPQKRSSYFQSLLDQVKRLPAVTSSGFVSALPLSHRESMSTLEIKGHVVSKDQVVDSRTATVPYFESMGIRLVEGRFFGPADIVVSQSFAKTYFAGEPAIGQQLHIGEDASGPWHTVVGVVSDVRHTSLEEKPRPMVYQPFFPFAPSPAYLTVRAAIPPDQLLASISKIVRGIDPAIALEHAGTMRQLVDEATSRRRFQTIVLTVFAGTAVFLALVGLYGLMAYAVKQRTAEIGIRIALGASAPQILGMVLGKGLSLVAVGLAIGLAGALAITRLGTSWLFGISAADPVTFVLVTALILVVALGACLIPAWKATRIDPMTALRSI